MNSLDELLDNLHPSNTIINRGIANVEGKSVEAVEIKNLYGQHIVWGMFSVEKGKFKGKLANNANTDGVEYKPRNIWYAGTVARLEMDYNHHDKTAAWTKE